MKFFHYMNFILIVILLVGICIAEDLVVSNSLRQVQTDCYEIESLLDSYDHLKNMDITLAVDNLEYDWTENEENMCFMVNHKNIQEIGVEIAKLKLYIASDDVDGFKVSIEQIKFYCHSYLHFMGANWHNVL